MPDAHAVKAYRTAAAAAAVEARRCYLVDRHGALATLAELRQHEC